MGGKGDCVVVLTREDLRVVLVVPTIDDKGGLGGGGSLPPTTGEALVANLSLMPVQYEGESAVAHSCFPALREELVTAAAGTFR